jgi:hypothetical protein
MKHNIATLRAPMAVGVLVFAVILGVAPKARPIGPLTDGSFYIYDLGHRCVDFGAEVSWNVGSPVYIYSCNGTIAQQVRIKELDGDTHDVQLMVESRFCIGVHGGQVLPNRSLELQTCTRTSPAQRFAIDGDAILMGLQGSASRVSREYVIEPQNDSTNLRTPLVVGTREVNDAEYFRFKPVKEPALKPTSGFVTAASEAGLDIALALGWGTVIEVDPSAPIVLKGTLPKIIHAGTTLRGYRKYLSQGPNIIVCTSTPAPGFQINEDNVRVTGLRLHGPLKSECKNTSPPEAQAILIGDYVPKPQSTSAAAKKTAPKEMAKTARADIAELAGINAPPLACDVPQTYSDGRESGGCEHLPLVLIDHVDISYFTGSAVDTRGADGALQCAALTQYPRETPVRVIGNLITHDEAFGSVVGQGAFVLDQGNVAYQLHAQAVSSDPAGLTGYAAFDNLFLSDERKTSSIDMHGSLHPGHWYGGIAGDYHDVGYNTSLRNNIETVGIRGTPCRFVAIHDNIFTQSKGDAIANQSTDPVKTVTYANKYNVSNPMSPLAVGDFDGDGVDDVFVGTGAGWYFSSGGQSEWRFLNRMTEKADALLFADLDGDGRTDVIALHGANIDVSWGGLSPWQTINVMAWKLSDLAVGDFDGDGNADLFLATGQQWFYAPGGRNWKLLGASVYRTPQLRFGDFQHTGRIEAIRIHGGRWLVAGVDHGWQDIGAAPDGLNSVTGLVVADFAGQGHAELAGSIANANSGNHVNPWIWLFTVPGEGTNWTTLRPAPQPISLFPIGRFDNNRTSDVLLWSGLDFVYASAGHDPLLPLSRQEMW